MWEAALPSKGYTLFIRIKEYDKCEAEDISDWSLVDSTSVDPLPITIYIPYGPFTPVVAPLTVPVSTGSKERYLIGWVITYPVNGQLQSVTYLRGLQTGSEWITGATSGVETQNENWGVARGGSTNPATGKLYAGIWAKDSYGNIPHILTYGGTSLVPSSFVSVTSNESNWNGNIGNIGDQSQEIVYTGDGRTFNSGVWDLNAQYQTTVSSTNPLLGKPSGETGPTPLYTPYEPGTKTEIIGGKIYVFFTGPYHLNYDRNPSVTITSTGEKIAAWEHNDGITEFIVTGWIHGMGGIEWCSLPDFAYSSIKIAETGKTGKWSPIPDKITETAGSFYLGGERLPNGTTAPGWLRNPSLTAFPKTNLSDVTSGGATGTDHDPGAAELLYWTQQSMNIDRVHCTWNSVNQYKLHEAQFSELKGDPHTAFDLNFYSNDPVGGSPGDIVWPASNVGLSGANAQRSFGIYNSGPQYHSGTNASLWRDLGTTLTDNYINGLSYGIGNDVDPATFTIKTTIGASTPDIGAYKGTFDTALGVQLYRSETRVKDSSEVTFKWGKVYVEDTALGDPIREVMLHNGIPDSNVFVSHDAMRDSIFQTEWFNWPVSAEVKYDRMMLVHPGGYYDMGIDSVETYLGIVDSSIVDSVVVYDTVVDSSMVYDTIPGTFHEDTTHRPDSCFIAPGVHMKYTVQMVHANGHIDTIEKPTYDPENNLYILPTTVTIANAGFADDTVMLRVIGDFEGIPDADTLVGFDRETMLDTYPSYYDTTIAIGTGGGILLPPDTCFYVTGPYSNPSHPSAYDVSILVHYCAAGSIITAQVYNSLGYPVGGPSTYSSDGQTWDRLPITAPSTSGSYHITVTVGTYSNTLGYIVY